MTAAAEPARIPVETMREVAQDFAALARYAPRVLRALAEKASEMPPEIPPAYLTWLEYLMTLRMALKIYPRMRLELSADTARGLAILEVAAREFETQARVCARCGRITDGLLACASCGQPRQAQTGGLR